MSEFPEQRDRMVKRQIAGRGVTSPIVLDAMRKVPREAFLPPGQGIFAYDDSPQPIGEGQTISQPYVVALMAEALKLTGGEKVLEIGTGSGYAAAVLGEIAADVFTIERIESLADKARENLQQQGYDNVRVRCADGTLGWPDEAPFDGILVSAGAPEVPESLKRQLGTGGRLVIPVGQGQSYQQLILVTRIDEEEWSSEGLIAVRFVPLLGEEGWPSAAGWYSS